MSRIAHDAAAHVTSDVVSRRLRTLVLGVGGIVVTMCSWLAAILLFDGA